MVHICDLSLKNRKLPCTGSETIDIQKDTKKGESENKNLKGNYKRFSTFEREMTRRNRLGTNDQNEIEDLEIDSENIPIDIIELENDSLIENVIIFTLSEKFDDELKEASEAQEKIALNILDQVAQQFRNTISGSDRK
ncbi:hypothetical protein HHI36_005353 [Cryptolaemus montrouzieri]|uniref:Uncharacterized protein n=1 Tax=Cryptolaemus montrouzieri TaxID=559131 RepID=A0ABD2NUD9_9CUCU